MLGLSGMGGRLSGCGCMQQTVEVGHAWGVGRIQQNAEVGHAWGSRAVVQCDLSRNIPVLHLSPLSSRLPAKNRALSHCHSAAARQCHPLPCSITESNST